jgi:UDP-glucuronate 4-epimerase
MKILVTGAAGFIGAQVSRLLLARGDEVVGIDSLNDYYDPALKTARLASLTPHAGFRFTRCDVADADALAQVFAGGKFDRVVHLAAQAGVRYSLKNPQAYVQSNLVGFANVLEACRRNAIAHLVYASSSSVYGGNAKVPFSVQDAVNHPVSLYAATKRSNELMAHSYSHLFGLPTTALRYFTVYGPWGRPDMSPWLFTQAILEDRPIDVFNHGKMQRDFTYVDDIAEATVRVLDRAATADPGFDARSPDPASSHAPYRIYNVGNHSPVELMDFIAAIESALGRKARLNFLPLQAGDVVATCADISELSRDFGFEPQTPLAEGIANWVRWYADYSRQIRI